MYRTVPTPSSGALERSFSYCRYHNTYHGHLLCRAVNDNALPWHISFWTQSNERGNRITNSLILWLPLLLSVHMENTTVPSSQKLCIKHNTFHQSWSTTLSMTHNTFHEMHLLASCNQIASCVLRVISQWWALTDRSIRCSSPPLQHQQAKFRMLHCLSKTVSVQLW